MGNTHLNYDEEELFYTFDKAQWTKIQQLGLYQLWYNPQTHQLSEAYKLERIPNDEQLEHYRFRHIYHQNLVGVNYIYIEKEPNLCSHGHSFVLTQFIPLTLDEINRQITLRQGYAFLRSTYGALNTLGAFYEPFRPQERLIGVNVQGYPKIWLNNNHSLNQTINCLQAGRDSLQLEVQLNKNVQLILQMIQEKLHHPQTNNKFPQQFREYFFKNLLNYFQACNYVEQYCDYKGINVPKRINYYRLIKQAQMKQIVQKYGKVEVEEMENIHRQGENNYKQRKNFYGQGQKSTSTTARYLVGGGQVLRRYQSVKNLQGNKGRYHPQHQSYYQGHNQPPNQSHYYKQNQGHYQSQYYRPPRFEEKNRNALPVIQARRVNVPTVQNNRENPLIYHTFTNKPELRHYSPPVVLPSQRRKLINYQTPRHIMGGIVGGQVRFLSANKISSFEQPLRVFRKGIEQKKQEGQKKQENQQKNSKENKQTLQGDGKKLDQVDKQLKELKDDLEAYNEQQEELSKFPQKQFQQEQSYNRSQSNQKSSKCLKKDQAEQEQQQEGQDYEEQVEYFEERELNEYEANYHEEMLYAIQGVSSEGEQTEQITREGQSEEQSQTQEIQQRLKQQQSLSETYKQKNERQSKQNGQSEKQNHSKSSRQQGKRMQFQALYQEERSDHLEGQKRKQHHYSQHLNSQHYNSSQFRHQNYPSQHYPQYRFGHLQYHNHPQQRIPSQDVSFQPHPYSQSQVPMPQFYYYQQQQGQSQQKVSASNQPNYSANSNYEEEGVQNFTTEIKQNIYVRSQQGQQHQLDRENQDGIISQPEQLEGQSNRYKEGQRDEEEENDGQHYSFAPKDIRLGTLNIKSQSARSERQNSQQSTKKQYDNQMQYDESGNFRPQSDQDSIRQKEASKLQFASRKSNQGYNQQQKERLQQFDERVLTSQQPLEPYSQQPLQPYTQTGLSQKPYADSPPPLAKPTSPSLLNSQNNSKRQSKPSTQRQKQSKKSLNHKGQQSSGTVIVHDSRENLYQGFQQQGQGERRVDMVKIRQQSQESNEDSGQGGQDKEYLRRQDQGKYENRYDDYNPYQRNSQRDEYEQRRFNQDEQEQFQRRQNNHEYQKSSKDSRGQEREFHIRNQSDQLYQYTPVDSTHQPTPSDYPTMSHHSQSNKQSNNQNDMTIKYYQNRVERSPEIEQLVKLEKNEDIQQYIKRKYSKMIGVKDQSTSTFSTKQLNKTQKGRYPYHQQRQPTQHQKQLQQQKQSRSREHKARMMTFAKPLENQLASNRNGSQRSSAQNSQHSQHQNYPNTNDYTHTNDYPGPNNSGYSNNPKYSNNEYPEMTHIQSKYVPISCDQKISPSQQPKSSSERQNSQSGSQQLQDNLNQTNQNNDNNYDYLDVKNLEKSLDQKYKSMTAMQSDRREIHNVKKSQVMSQEDGFNVEMLEKKLIKFEQSRQSHQLSRSASKAQHEIGFVQSKEQIHEQEHEESNGHQPDNLIEMMERKIQQNQRRKSQKPHQNPSQQPESSSYYNNKIQFTSEIQQQQINQRYMMPLNQIPILRDEKISNQSQSNPNSKRYSNEANHYGGELDSEDFGTDRQRDDSANEGRQGGRLYEPIAQNRDYSFMKKPNYNIPLYQENTYTLNYENYADSAAYYPPDTYSRPTHKRNSIKRKSKVDEAKKIARELSGKLDKYSSASNNLASLGSSYDQKNYSSSYYKIKRQSQVPSLKDLDQQNRSGNYLKTIHELNSEGAVSPSRNDSSIKHLADQNVKGNREQNWRQVSQRSIHSRQSIKNKSEKLGYDELKNLLYN